MFNIFGAKTDYVVPEKAQIPELEPQVNLYEDALYTVGRNEHGMIQLVLKSGNVGRTTLSMDPKGTRHMIRMLEAALDEPQEQEDE